MYTIRHWEKNVDLRKITRSKLFWWAAKKKLGEGDAILLTNAKFDRCRLIVLSGGLPWMMSPPVRDRRHTLGWIMDMAIEWISNLPAKGAGVGDIAA